MLDCAPPCENVGLELVWMHSSTLCLHSFRNWVGNSHLYQWQRCDGIWWLVTPMSGAQSSKGVNHYGEVLKVYRLLQFLCITQMPLICLFALQFWKIKIPQRAETMIYSSTGICPNWWASAWTFLNAHHHVNAHPMIFNIFTFKTLCIYPRKYGSFISLYQPMRHQIKLFCKFMSNQFHVTIQISHYYNETWLKWHVIQVLGLVIAEFEWCSHPLLLN